MKKLLLMFLLLLFQATVVGQVKLRPIAQDVKSAKTSKIKMESFDLFSVTNDKSKMNRYAEALKEVEILNLNQNQLRELSKSQPYFLSVNIPYKGKNLHLKLVKKEIVTPEFSVETDKGIYNYKQEGAFYHGIIEGDQLSVVTLSVFDKDVNAYISSRTLGNVILAKSTDNVDYLLYNDIDLKGQKNAFCSVSDDVKTDGKSEVVYQPEMSKVDATTKRVKLYYEIGKDIYAANSSDVAKTVNWMMSVQNNVSTLYYNDGIKVILNKVFVWTTDDPYRNMTSSSDILYAFRSNRPSIGGDLGQFLNLKSNLGGIAFRDALCYSSIKYSYSGVQTSYSSVPTYSWTVEVITHEFGHNMGSRHTHACVWNNNNTPIDGCAVKYNSAYAEDGCTTVGPIPSKGTIMSYCHLLNNVGINLSLGFGEQPGALIRNRINNASCLGTINRRYVKPGGTGDGLSWTTAANLSDALRWAYDSRNSYQWSAEEPLEIWVAKGYHVPTYQYGGGATRDRTFALVKDVLIYGGFNGDETQLSQRKPSINETVLNGDKVSAHVVVSAGDVGSALLDGFTIWQGKADHNGSFSINGQTVDHRYGGGILMNNSSPTILNTIIKDNYSVNRGGGVYMLNDSKPIFQNVVFMQNEAGASNGDGGAIYTDTSNNRGFLTLINCTIINNKASDGGAIRFNHNIGVKFYNNIFYSNTSGNNPNTLNSELSFNFNQNDFNSKNVANIRNNIFQYYNQGTNTYNSNPNLSGFNLSSGSFAINKGNNSLYTDISSLIVKPTIDVQGKIRVVNGTIDLGASEVQCTINAPVTENQNFIFCGSSRISDLISRINSTNVSIYANLTDYEPLATTTFLTNGQTYYVYRVDTSGCTSTKVPVKVAINTIPTRPTVSTPSNVCSGFKLSDLTVTGSNIKWYDEATGGNTLPNSTVVQAGKWYYASQTVNGCESTNRAAVIIYNVFDKTAPTVVQPIAACEGSLNLSNIVVSSGQGTILWYNAATGGSILSPQTIVREGVTYYVARSSGSCETDRTAFTASEIKAIPAIPIAETQQTFAPGSTLSNIVIQGSNIRWFASSTDAINNINSLPNSTALTSGYYYAIATNGICYSQPLSVEVIIDSTLGVEDRDLNNISVYPSPFKDVIHLKNKSKITNVKIFSSSGNLVLNRDYNQNEISINATTIPVGVYILKVKIGNQEISKKVIKK